MKRLISWLLALTLIVGLLPMSVFAAVDVETGEGNDDEVVDFWELLEGGSAENPLTPAWVWNDAMTEATASVTIPAGKTMYLQTYNIGGMYMTINDGEAALCEAMPRAPYSWTIINEGAEEATYALKIYYPEGHQMNPKIIESMYYSDEVTQELGDTDGFFYKYIAPADGTVTVYINPEYDEETWELINYGTQRNIMVTNNTTYAQYDLLQDGVDNNGLELVVPVSAGDELIINTAWVQDADGNYYPAGTYSWAGNFTYPVGTEQNPANIEWTWNDAQTVATATVTVEADGTYYAGISGMILTVDGVETEMSETAAFMLNAGTYELVLSTPEGTYNNPAQLVIGENTATVAAGSWGGYMYTWTAEEAGTLSLTMPSDQGWFYVINNTTTGAYGDGQWSDSDPVVNPGTIEVAAGDVLSIEVNTYDPADPWTNPGGTVTFTAAFEVASTCEHANTTTTNTATCTEAGVETVVCDDCGETVSTTEVPALGHDYSGENGACIRCGEYQTDANLIYALKGISFQDYIGLQFAVTQNLAKKYDSIYVETAQVTPNGVVNETLTGVDLLGYYLVFDKQIVSWSMTEDVTMTLYAVKDGVTYVGESVTTSVEELAIAKIADYASKSNTVMCTALVDMLNYGAAVQVSNAYNDTNLPNAQVEPLGYDQYATAETPDLADVNSVTGTGTMKVYLENFSMQAKVEIQLAVLAIDTSKYEIRATIDGEQISGAYFDNESVSGFTVVRVPIAAKNMRKMITLAVYDIETGEAVTSVYNVSVEGYSYKKLGTDGEATVIAVMKYGDAIAAIG